MTRNKYIELCNNNQEIMVCYNYFLEKGGVALDYGNFHKLFTMFVNMVGIASPQALLKKSIEVAMNYYDNKFGVQRLYDAKNNFIKIVE